MQVGEDDLFASLLEHHDQAEGSPSGPQLPPDLTGVDKEPLLNSLEQQMVDEGLDHLDGDHAIGESQLVCDLFESADILSLVSMLPLLLPALLSYLILMNVAPSPSHAVSFAQDRKGLPIEDANDWLDLNQMATKDGLDEQMSILESTVTPIMKLAYERAAEAKPGGGHGSDDSLDDHDEL